MEAHCRLQGLVGVVCGETRCWGPGLLFYYLFLLVRVGHSFVVERVQFEKLLLLLVRNLQQEIEQGCSQYSRMASSLSHYIQGNFAFKVSTTSTIQISFEIKVTVKSAYYLPEVSAVHTAVS